MTTLDIRPAVVAAEAEAAYKWRWPALFVILVGSAIELLDSSVTNIAGPTMRADLGGGTSVIQWLGAAYTLAMVAGLLTGGRLGDIFGRKRMFMIGLLGFMVGSVFCAIAVSPETAIAARAVQGLFGAAMIPQGLGMMREMFKPKELMVAFGAMGPVMGLSAIGGPVLAGALIDADFFGTGWRMVFLINVPIGVVAAIAAMLFLPGTKGTRGVRLDLPGALLASLGALLIVFPLVQGREHGWPAWSFAMMAASAAVFFLFARFEVRKSRQGGDPLVVPSLFGKRSFLGGMAVGAIYFASLVGLGLVFNLYAQMGLGYSPLKAGLSGVPMSVGIIAGMSILPMLRKHGRKVLQGGALVILAGIGGLVLSIGPGVSPWALVPSLLLIGLGSGLVMGPYFEIALAEVEPHETGSASGTLTALQHVGSAVGVALFGTVFFGTISVDPTTAAQITFGVVAGMVVLTFLVSFLLPKQVGEEAPPVH